MKKLSRLDWLLIVLICLTVFNIMIKLVNNMEISEARKKANQKWDNKNKARMKYLRYRSYTKSFIKQMATSEDLRELKQLINERETDK